MRAAPRPRVWLLDGERMSDVLNALLRLHDGDDRCGCLRAALLLVDNGKREDAIEVVQECLESHPAGSIYRGKG